MTKRSAHRSAAITAETARQHQAAIAAACLLLIAGLFIGQLLLLTSP